MVSKELNSLLQNALSKKSKSLELYQSLVDNSTDNEVQNMIADNIVSTEKKHEALLQKMLQQVSNQDDSTPIEKNSLKKEKTGVKSPYKKAMIEDEKFISNLRTKKNIEQIVNKKHAGRLRTIALLPDESCFISEYYGSRNFGPDSALFTGRYLREGDSYRSLLKFDLEALPDEARIIKAELVLDIGRNEARQGELVKIFGLREDWYESKVTWCTQPEYYEGMTSSVPVAPGYLGSVSIDLTEFVLAWQQDDLINYGIIIKGCESRNSLIALSGRNHENPGQRPVLRIEFWV